jgi:squalene synthase HpnC
MVKAWDRSAGRRPVAAPPAGTPAGPERERGENFPVVLRALPEDYRRDLHAVYAYARFVDEIGDSHSGDALARLAAVAADIERVWAPEPGGQEPVEPVLERLRTTVAARGLSAEPFRRLVAANVSDQEVSRYPTFDDLAGYCRLSADPVGRVVLEVFGQSTRETEELSDRVCTALQLLEHWQDVGEDRRAGRVYLPQEDLRAYAVTESDLDQRVAGAALRRLMCFEVDRAATLLAEGAGIVGRLHGWGRVSVAGYVAGGLATVDALRATGGDVLSRSARPTKVRTTWHLARLLAGRRPRGGGER